MPWAVGVLAALGLLLVAVPIAGLLARVPWAKAPELLRSDVALDALRVSLVASLGATAVSAIVGIPLAFVLARGRFKGRTIARGAVLLPLVLPPVVAGTALLAALGRTGLLGEPIYERSGLVLPFSIWGVVIAATFVSMPFLVVTVEGALRNSDMRLEGAASSLGASKWAVLRRVTLPSVAPSIAAGLVLTWARALGEFGATITFAGSLQGRTQTLPLAVFVTLSEDRELALVLSVVMVLVSLLVLIALRGRWWRT